MLRNAHPKSVAQTEKGVVKGIVEKLTVVNKSTVKVYVKKGQGSERARGGKEENWDTMIGYSQQSENMTYGGGDPYEREETTAGRPQLRLYHLRQLL